MAEAPTRPTRQFPTLLDHDLLGRDWRRMLSSTTLAGGGAGRGAVLAAPFVSERRPARRTPPKGAQEGTFPNFFYSILFPGRDKIACETQQSYLYLITVPSIGLRGQKRDAPLRPPLGMRGYSHEKIRSSAEKLRSSAGKRDCKSGLELESRSREFNRITG